MHDTHSSSPPPDALIFPPNLPPLPPVPDGYDRWEDCGKEWPEGSECYAVTMPGWNEWHIQEGVSTKAKGGIFHYVKAIKLPKP